MAKDKEKISEYLDHKYSGMFGRPPRVYIFYLTRSLSNAMTSHGCIDVFIELVRVYVLMTSKAINNLTVMATLKKIWDAMLDDPKKMPTKLPKKLLQEWVPIIMLCAVPNITPFDWHITKPKDASKVKAFFRPILAANQFALPDTHDCNNRVGIGPAASHGGHSPFGAMQCRLVSVVIV